MTTLIAMAPVTTVPITGKERKRENERDIKTTIYF